MLEGRVHSIADGEAKHVHDNVAETDAGEGCWVIELADKEEVGCLLT